jgi:hypothetical protein
MTATDLVVGLLEGDEDFDVKAFVTKRPEPKSIAIVGKRWWRPSYGGTYFRFYVYIDGNLVHQSELHSGYGDHYLEVGTQWLEDEGYIPKRPTHSNGSRTPGWQWIRDTLKIPLEYYARDVKRQKDT